MADTKDGREKRAADDDNRQRERDMEAAQRRGDEAEPPIDPDEVDEVDEVEAALEPLTFPATGREIVA
ncbi:MAG: hypothetical protein ACOCPY_02600, partial [Halorubrum sp.]